MFTLATAMLETVTGGANDPTRPPPIRTTDSTEKVRRDTEAMRTAISHLTPQQARAILVRDYGTQSLKR